MPQVTRQPQLVAVAVGPATMRRWLPPRADSPGATVSTSWTRPGCGQVLGSNGRRRATGCSPVGLPTWTSRSLESVSEALVRLAAGGDLGYSRRQRGNGCSRKNGPLAWLPGTPGPRRRGGSECSPTWSRLLRCWSTSATSGGDGVLLLTPSYPPLLQMLPRSWAVVCWPSRRLLPAWAGPLTWTRPQTWRRRGQGHAPGEPAQPDRAACCTGPSWKPSASWPSATTCLSSPTRSTQTSGWPARRTSRSPRCQKSSRPARLPSTRLASRTTSEACAVPWPISAMPACRTQLAQLPSHLLGRVSIAAVATTLASWSPEGDAWLERCLSRLRGNRELLGPVARQLWRRGRGRRGGLSPRGDLPLLARLPRDGLGDDPAAWLLPKASVMLSGGSQFRAGREPALPASTSPPPRDPGRDPGPHRGRPRNEGGDAGGARRPAHEQGAPYQLAARG